MSNYQLILQRQKKSLKAYAILCLALIIGIGAHAYFKWSDYTRFKTATTLNQTEVKKLNTDVNNKNVAYQKAHEDYDKLTGTIESGLKEVFPQSDNYTELNRAFDNLEASLNRAKSLFVISSIDYQDVAVSEDGTYRYLPLRMNIVSSPENFTKFLQYIEESGSLNEKVRLMDIQSIHLSFGDSEESGGSQGLGGNGETGVSATEGSTITFSVKIHAYFQNNR